jgi:hypothetical protein
MSSVYFIIDFGEFCDAICCDHCPRVGEYICLTTEQHADLSSRKYVKYIPKTLRVSAVVHHPDEANADRKTRLIVEPAEELLRQVRRLAREVMTNEPC